MCSFAQKYYLLNICSLLRNVASQSDILEPAGLNKNVASNVASVDDMMETEENLTGSKKPSDSAPVKTLNDSPAPDMADDVDKDLEDSEDEMAYREPSTSVVNRRRMVLDVEDDD